MNITGKKGKSKALKVNLHPSTESTIISDFLSFAFCLFCSLFLTCSCELYSKALKFPQDLKAAWGKWVHAFEETNKNVVKGAVLTSDSI